MSYAIIADGGRQYKVEPGQKLEIDYREAEAGSSITFDRVLAVSDDSGFRLGKPTVDGASVTAKVIGETKGDKVYIQKFRRRKIRSFLALAGEKLTVNCDRDRVKNQLR